jgi:hypothetical protein
VLAEPVEAGTEVSAASADWVEMERLSGRLGIDLVNLSVKVEDMHTLKPLAFEDGMHLSLEEPKLPKGWF